MHRIDEVLEALSRSAFRSGFRLGAKERQYLQDRGLDAIVEHGRRFVVQRLADGQPRNDGRQTPTRGHPVFITQHATATCCRRCLAKWHGIAEGKALGSEQVEYIVAVIKHWLERQMPDPPTPRLRRAGT